ncbi:MAG: hypothetical protein GPJ52_01770 [Candidatus Heimdallarchaeota archaeon]|nr:hypothetical protein [Candidatus Heimdallarchaeota archaeon]
MLKKPDRRLFEEILEELKTVKELLIIGLFEKELRHKTLDKVEFHEYESKLGELSRNIFDEKIMKM